MDKYVQLMDGFGVIIYNSNKVTTTRGWVHQSERMMIPAIVWNQLIPHLNVVDKGASITRDEVSKQVCGVLRALRWQW